jgi:DNA-binding NarL/FixJ family response regulator
MIVCRAELLLLGLERLLSRSPDFTVTTYSRVPPNEVEEERPEPDEPRIFEPAIVELPRQRGARTSVAVLSDRQGVDVIGDCRRLLESWVDEVVLLSSRPNIGLVLECMGAGARAFVMEGDPPDVLGSAIRAASHGRTYIGQRTLEMLVDWLAGQERSRTGAGTRAREGELLRLLAEGRSTAEIAQVLEVAPKTVRNRLSRLYRRLGVSSRAAAVRLAEERGLLDPRKGVRQPEESGRPD